MAPEARAAGRARSRGVGSVKASQGYFCRQSAASLLFGKLERGGEGAGPAPRKAVLHTRVSPAPSSRSPALGAETDRGDLAYECPPAFLVCSHSYLPGAGGRLEEAPYQGLGRPGHPGEGGGVASAGTPDPREPPAPPQC